MTSTSITRWRALRATCATLVALAAIARVPNVYAKPITPRAIAATTLSVEGRASANPSISANGRYVAVTWSAASVSTTDVYVAISRDGGATFSEPLRVNSTPGDARVNGEMPPRVVLVPRKGTTPELVVVWTSRAGANWKLLYARSSDDGRTFSISKPVPGSEGDGARGWHSATVDAQGRVSVIWLDHRETVKADAPHTHTMAAGAAAAPAADKPKADPTQRAALSHLYYATLDDSKASSITNSVCYCCKTSLLSVGSNVYAVWRHVYPGSMRDMAFAMSTNRGRTFSAPVRIARDQWQIDGCPDNGPSLAVLGDKSIHVAWPTAADGKDAKQLAVFYAVSRDGKTFGPRTRISMNGSASHPQITASTDGSTIVAWDEVVDGARRLGLARVRVNKGGVATATPIAAPDGAEGRWYPSLATASTGTVAVWVKQLDKGSNIEVARLQ